MVVSWGEPGICSDLPDAYRFFWTFSRFEYALKATGYVKNCNASNAEPDWNKFSKTLGEKFFLSVKSCNESRILFDSPPQKQVIRNCCLHWTDVGYPKNSQELFQAICRVRNNLFHGSKVPFNKKRDGDLIKASEFVLWKSLEQCATVKSKFCVSVK